MKIFIRACGCCVCFAHSEKTYDLRVEGITHTQNLDFHQKYWTLTYHFAELYEDPIPAFSRITVDQSGSESLSASDSIVSSLVEIMCRTLNDEVFNGEEVVNHPDIRTAMCKALLNFSAKEVTSNAYAFMIEANYGLPNIMLGPAEPSVIGELDIPGLSTRVDLPCDCLLMPTFGSVPGPNTALLSKAIIHLNDSHSWSRERIADWLDKLHDSNIVDTTIKEKR